MIVHSRLFMVSHINYPKNISKIRLTSLVSLILRHDYALNLEQVLSVKINVLLHVLKSLINILFSLIRLIFLGKLIYKIWIV